MKCRLKNTKNNTKKNKTNTCNYSMFLIDIQISICICTK